MSLFSCGYYLGICFYYELSSPLELTKGPPFFGKNSQQRLCNKALWLPSNFQETTNNNMYVYM